MPPDAASAADQWERDNDPDYRCTRCGHVKAPAHRYCDKCTRRIVKRAMRLFAQRRLLLVVPTWLGQKEAPAFPGRG